MASTMEISPTEIRKRMDRGKEEVETLTVRNVSNERPDSPRMREALRDVDPSRWRLFTDPAELPVPAG